MGVGPLGTPTVSEHIEQKFRVNAAPITSGEKNTHKQITDERNYYSKAAKDVIENSVYGKSGLINAPTASAKAGHLINITA